MKIKRSKRRLMLLVIIIIVITLAPLYFYCYGLYLVGSTTNDTRRDDDLHAPPPEAPHVDSILVKDDVSRRIQCVDDNKLNRETRAIPHFIIAGVQKGGTSALRAMLVQHPNIIASKRFEPHFFDNKLPRYLKQKFNATTDNIQKQWICDIQQHYVQSTFHQAALDGGHLLGSGLKYYFFEKTPSYLVDPDIPSLVDTVCPWKPKILVILRNPVDRAYSHYKMEREKLRVKDDFQSAVNEEIKAMRELGLTSAPLLPPPPADGASDDAHKSDFLSSQFIDKLQPEQFRLPAATPSGVVVETDAMSNDDDAHKRLLRNFPHANFVQRGMYAIQIQRWLRRFPLDESLLVLEFEELRAHPAAVYERILDFLGAPSFDLKSEDLFKDHRTIGGLYRRKGMVHPPLSNDTRRYLDLFFKPYNSLLADLLGRKLYDF